MMSLNELDKMSMYNVRVFPKPWSSSEPLHGLWRQLPHLGIVPGGYRLQCSAGRPAASLCHHICPTNAFAKECYRFVGTEA